MFKSKTKFLPPRLGERYASALANMSFNNKVIKKFGKISLKDYITSFIKDKKYENCQLIKITEKKRSELKTCEKKRKSIYNK